MTCKDCLHYEVCENSPVMEDGCPYFKDKSKFIEFPFEIGKWVFVVASMTSDNKNYRIFEDKIQAFRKSKYGKSITFENCHTAVSEWNFDKVFYTLEEAETKLKELNEK